MSDKLIQSGIPNEPAEIVIDDNPRNFHLDHVYMGVLDIIQRRNRGEVVRPDVCRCSQFHLLDLIDMAREGGFVEGLDENQPEQLARSITFHLYGEVVRIQDTRSGGSDCSLADFKSRVEAYLENNPD